jgi:hypothetical protein
MEVLPEAAVLRAEPTVEDTAGWLERALRGELHAGTLISVSALTERFSKDRMITRYEELFVNSCK